jgi:nitroreductase
MAAYPRRVTLIQSPAELIAFLRGLRQIRQLRPDALPTQVLDDILEVARWTGSARNLQPWDFVVIQNHDLLAQLASIEGNHAPHLTNAAVGIALVMSGDLEHPEFDTYDEGRLSERIMLAAAAHGLGSAIGWFSGPSSAEAKRILGIPEHRLLRSVVSIGAVDADARRQRTRPAEARKALERIVHRERW